MADVSSIDISRLERKMDRIGDMTQQLQVSLKNTEQAMVQVSSNMRELVNSFEVMMDKQEKQAALQQAATELVRVRQEIERDYGNYRIIRETMLGVLQATDLALVKKSTISRVTEELMLSTPKYWLAPCLVAIAAWIDNDRDLAERAIAEAVKRDEERTAIVMALICRRNNRIDTCYEWLSIYFAHQDSANFSEGSFAYIDAYLNGIFGPDEKHMCDDYITKWMNEIKGNSSTVEESQEKIWKEYCMRFSKDIYSLCPDLSQGIKEYQPIKDYVGRILAVDSIAEKFAGINNAYVDSNSLKTKIDKSLIQLISRYNDDEEPLHKEEEYLKAIKVYEGDKAAAQRAIIKQEQERRTKTMNLVEQMTSVLTSYEDKSPSERKTALLLLSGYIRKGFNTYIEEKKPAFPQQVTVEIDGWSGKSQYGTEAEALCQDYTQFMTTQCMAKVEKEKNNNEIFMYIGSGIGALIGLILLFKVPFLGVLLMGGAAALLVWSFKYKKDRAKRIERIKEEFDEQINKGKQRIRLVTQQWGKVKNLVNDYEASPKKEIVA